MYPWLHHGFGAVTPYRLVQGGLRPSCSGLVCSCHADSWVHDKGVSHPCHPTPYIARRVVSSRRGRLWLASEHETIARIVAGRGVPLETARRCEGATTRYTGVWGQSHEATSRVRRPSAVTSFEQALMTRNSDAKRLTVVAAVRCAAGTLRCTREEGAVREGWWRAFRLSSEQ